MHKKVMMGHDYHPHIWTTTVSHYMFHVTDLVQGRISDELHFSHCLGAASEGGFRDIQVMHRLIMIHT